MSPRPTFGSIALGNSQLQKNLESEHDRRIRLVNSGPLEALRFLSPPLIQRGLVNIDMGNWCVPLSFKFAASNQALLLISF